MIQAMTELVNWQHFPAFISVIAASLTAWSAIRITKLSRKNQLALENRKMKQDMYFAYLDAIGNYGNTAKNQTDDEKERNTNQWVDAHNRLVLVGNTESINAMMAFEECAKKSTRNQQPGEYKQVLDHLIKAFRADLFDDKAVNQNLTQLSLLTASLKKPLADIEE